VTREGMGISMRKETGRVVKVWGKGVDIYL
jgi:hypothetical protein